MDKPVSEMNKQELQDYAKGFGVVLDMRRPVEDLQKQVGKLTAKTAAPTLLEKAKPFTATHLKHPVTGLFWPWHKLLEERGDLIPCDENGHVAE